MIGFATIGCGNNDNVCFFFFQKYWITLIASDLAFYLPGKKIML